jgi:hypothetical protein
MALAHRRTFLLAVGGALAWVGREVVPRLAPLALDLWDSAREMTKGGERTHIPADLGRSRGRRGR